MNKPNPVGWFEIPVVDLDRAEKFYQTILGTTLERQPEKDGMTMSWFPMLENAYGAPGSLVLNEMIKPATGGAGVVIYFTVPDFDDALARVESAGGKIVVPKTDIGEHGFFATILDSEGNRIALHRHK